MVLNVLTAEADDAAAEAISAAITGMGHAVLWRALSGPEALALAVRHRPHLVTMAASLGDTSGIIAASAISSTLGIPVVMVTNMVDASVAEEAGAAAFVPKPVDEAELRRAVELAMRLYPAAGAPGGHGH